MQKNKLILLILTLCGTFLSSANAQDSKEPKTSSGSSTAAVSKFQAGPNKKRLGYDASEFMPKENNFGIILSYGAGFDQLEPMNNERKTVRHQFGLSATYSFTQRWSSYLSAGVGYVTHENKIFKANDDDTYYQMSNLNPGVVYAIRPKGGPVAVISNTLNVALPVSEESQTDQHYADISLTTYAQSHNWHRLSLYNRLTADYLWTRLRYSLYNDNALNRNWVYSESFGLSYQIMDNLGARAGLQVDAVRYLDSTWDVTFGNQVSLFANILGAQVFAGMVNRAYPENERLDFGYYDKYRRLIRIGVSYAF